MIPLKAVCGCAYLQMTQKEQGGPDCWGKHLGQEKEMSYWLGLSSCRLGALGLVGEPGLLSVCKEVDELV